jgi:uncharacterized protein
MITQFVLKLNRVCNLRCTYCYYINDATELPGLRMSWPILRTFLDKYADYCRRHSLRGRIVFHGGEPLLMGRAYMDRALSHRGFVDNALHASVQTNGLLLDDDWLDLLRKHNVAIGISLDGPKEVHDMYRVTAAGRPSYDQTIWAIQLMQRRGEDVGVLAVINPKADGQEVFQHFVNLGIKRIDFLFPQTNHALHSIDPMDMEGIKQYLVRAFLAWFNLDDPTIRVRLFRELIKRYFAEGLGYAPIGISRWQDLAILETDGTIAQLEELAEADRYDGGKRYNTGFDILNCDIEEVETYMNKFWLDIGTDELPSLCKSCDMNYICHGGNAGTRFDAMGSFDNPGVHCASLYALAKLIERQLLEHGYPKRVVFSPIEPSAE